MALDDGAVAPGRVSDTPQGGVDVVRFSRAHGVERIGLEAAGGYDIEIIDVLREAGFRVALLQPVQVGACANFLKLPAKTDPIDAALIAAASPRIGRSDRPPTPGWPRSPNT